MLPEYDHNLLTLGDQSGKTDYKKKKKKHRPHH